MEIMAFYFGPAGNVVYDLMQDLMSIARWNLYGMLQPTFRMQCKSNNLFDL